MIALVVAEPAYVNTAGSDAVSSAGGYLVVGAVTMPVTPAANVCSLAMVSTVPAVIEVSDMVRAFLPHRAACPAEPRLPQNLG